MTARISLTVLPNGPYKVSGATTAKHAGEPLKVEGDLYFCRCGESKNAPFCDGSHQKVGFEGTSPEREAKGVKVWEGKTLRTHFNQDVCMHVFYCKPLRELRERELAGDTSAATEIMRVVETCPSGALTYEVKEDPEVPAPRDVSVEIDVIEGGELRVQAPFEINAELHERHPEDRATLCRCGLSMNKPFCDGRHKARKDFR